MRFSVACALALIAACAFDTGPVLAGPAPQETLTVTRAGSGSGTVSSNPAGITCGGDCTENYASGQSVTLTAVPAAGSTFTGWLGACTGTATCSVTMSAAKNVSATFAPNTLAPPRVDADVNRAYDALTDGLIILRWMFGLSGASLTAGALGPGALNDPAQLAARLDDYRPALDIDANGQVDALSDGLLVLRYLFQLRGSALIASAVGAGAARTTAAQIEPYIQSLMPFPVPSTGTAITAANQTWTFVPFTDAFCDDGTTTGIGVNLSNASTNVLIVLPGGGACWDETTCYTLNTAVHGPFGATQFNAAAASLNTVWLFNRGDATNPFKDWNYVYAPYCTGDWHAGNKTVQYGSHTHRHVGYANIAAYLNRIVPTFPSAGVVFMAGVSTGGYGALFNWWQVQQRFGGVPVHVIDDSGTLMPSNVVSPTSAAELLRRGNWGLDQTLPPGCTACASGLDAILPYYAGALPNRRFALVSHDPDSVIAGYYSISSGQFSTGLTTLIANSIAPAANFRSFVAAGNGHTWLGNSNISGVTSGGVSLPTFITQMVNNDPGWLSRP